MPIHLTLDDLNDEPAGADVLATVFNPFAGFGNMGAHSHRAEASCSINQSQHGLPHPAWEWVAGVSRSVFT